MTHFRSFIFWAACIFALLGSAASSAAAVTFTNSPSTVSNSYNGTITLQIGGLTNGETVVVQKFLDANTNGILGAGDLLVQQFQLSDGQASVFDGVTNFNVPGDADSTTGQITAPLNFQNGDFAQSLVGKYLYKLSSPSGHFAPITNLFTVTNAYYSQLVTGAIQNVNSLTNIPNAIVFLFASQNGALNVKAGAVANNSGYFSIRAAPGTYLLAAMKSNFVADISAASVTLSADTTNQATVNLIPATGKISGKIVDAATNSIGLPGVLGIAQSTNNLLAFYFTDTNGNFNAQVTSNFWTVEADDFAAAFHGYLTWQTNRLVAVTNSSIPSVTNALPKATAIFYGSVKDDSGNPMPGVFLYGSDSAGHQTSGVMTDQNGNYVGGALAGMWQLGVAANNPGLTNFYVFSPGLIQTNVSDGQAILQNFILQLAPFYINGSVKDFNGNPIVGVQVFATADINGTNYQAVSVNTDTNGNYSLNVCEGTWTVGVLCTGGTNSLQSLGNYQCPDTQSIDISDPGGTVNFSILLCGQIGILTATNLPDGAVGSYYSTQLQASSCEPIAGWSTAYGVTLTSLYDQTNVVYLPGTPVYSKPSQIGYLLTPFSFGVTTVKNGYAVYGNGVSYTYSTSGSDVYFQNVSATVNVSAPITNNIVVMINKKKWNAQPTTQDGATYTTVLTQNSGLEFEIYPPGSFIFTNGMLMTNTVSSPSKTAGALGDLFHSLTPGSSLNTDFVAPYTNSDDAIVWIGNAQYLISAYGPQDTTNIFDTLPQGMILYTNGTLAGTPVTNGTFNFTVRAMDVDLNTAVQTFSLFINPATTLGAPAYSSTNGQFQMQVNGIAGQNYTVQMSTNLASTNWITIFTTNSPDGSFLITDPDATNPSRFYRVLLGP